VTAPARVRQTEITRAIKAAQRAGLKVVGVRPDGTVLTASQDDARPELDASRPPVAMKRKIELA
jgi:hypothetical protein